jgi:hypothetical protein
LGELKYNIKQTVAIIDQETRREVEDVARVGEERVLVGYPEEKIPIGRTRRRWEVGIRMDLR